MSETTSDTRPFAPLTSLLLALVVAGVFNVVTSVISSIGMWQTLTSLSGEFDATDETEALALAPFWRAELAMAGVGLFLTLAGLAGFVALRRGSRLDRLHLSTLIVGAAIAPLVVIGIDALILAAL